MIHYGEMDGAKGSVTVIAGATKGTHCWGIFEGELYGRIKGKDSARLIIPARKDRLEIMKAFIESEWFNRLTEGHVKLLGVGKEGAKHILDPGETLKRVNFDFAQTMVIEVDTSGPADRIVTACRLLTSVNRLYDEKLLTRLPEKYHWSLPIWEATIIAQGDSNSDSRVTFHALTAGQVDEYCAAHGKNRVDIYYEDFFEWYDEQVTPKLSPEAVGRVLTRSAEEFAFLSEQSGPLYMGYTKDDDRICDDGVVDDEVLTVSAPICDSAQPDERDTVGWLDALETMNKLFP